MRYAFYSDNASGVHPKILAAIVEANDGFALPYGADELSRRIDTCLSDIFGRECQGFLVPTGTAANGLALGALTPPYGAIFAHRAAHIVTTECGAPEFYSNGARIILLDSPDNKLTAEVLEDALGSFPPRNPHALLPASVSLTQATECGTTYTPEEISLIAEVARKRDLRLHMDGARFANALVHVGCSPAAMTWQAGVDVLSLGTTKNGTLGVEIVVAFDREISGRLRFMYKRAGFLYSKMRFQAAQVLAHLDSCLWLNTARDANRAAARVAAALSRVSGVRFAHPVEANEVFPHLPAALVTRLEQRGVSFRPWPSPTDDLYRLVFSYCEPETVIAAVEEACAEEVGENQARDRLGYNGKETIV